MQYHNPVLLQDCIDGLNIKPDGVYVDVTFGGGGHSREILKHLTTGKLIAFDQDADAIENKPDNANLILINQNFRYLKNYLRLHQITQIDGLLADLGVSSHQFDVAERGFSIRFDADLDMRMNKNATLTAKQILNTYEEAKLVILFKEYGEVINAKFLVKLICEYRSQQSINTVDQFKQLIKRATPRQKENQFLAQVFQALRIEVNDELQVLKEMLEQAVDLLKPGGRLVVMSYHSLEDKLVKNYIKQGKFFGEAEKDFFGNVTVPLKQITRKPIVPADIEVLTNSRARSAKLRIAEKI